MLVAEPAFGVGIGQYSPSSAQFAPTALLKIWRPDNAHNNLAQIAGELGLIGLTTFLFVLAASLSIRSNARVTNQLCGPLIAGLAAFILTWLGGHPLLIAEVAYAFWIALGLAAANVTCDSRENVPAGCWPGHRAASGVDPLPRRHEIGRSRHDKRDLWSVREDNS